MSRDVDCPRRARHSDAIGGYGVTRARVALAAIAAFVLAAACEPPRDPDFPQYTQPRPETLAWRRLTDQPSPELEVVPPPRRSPPDAPDALDAPDASLAVGSGAAVEGPMQPGRCRSVPAPPSCRAASPFACGIHHPSSSPSASSQPPVEMLFFARSLADAERLAKDAQREGALPLPPRSCRFVEVDACHMRADVSCSSADGQPAIRASVTL